MASRHGSYFSLVYGIERSVSILFDFLQRSLVHIRAWPAVPNKTKSSNYCNDSVYLRRFSRTRHKFVTGSIIPFNILRIRTFRKDSRMASISDLRIATPSTDKEIGPVPVSQSFLSLFMTRFRLWRSRFKRKDRQQVVGLQTVEGCVSDASGAIEIELDEYLATPTALTTPSFSVRSSIRSGVVNFGDDSERVTDAHGNGLGSLTSGNTLGLEGLSRFTVVNADGVLPAARSVSDFCELHTQLETQLEVCYLRYWTLITYQFGLEFAFDQRLFDSNS